MDKLNEPIKPSDIDDNGPIQKRNVMLDDFGIDIAVEAVPLPSRGVIYNNNSLQGTESVEIKPMTAREEDILTSRAYIKNGTVISKLIKSCLIDKSINPDDLISGDRNALLIALRITGYGSDYTLEINCPECGSTNKSTFDLSQLEIKRLKVDPVELGQNIFEVTLPITKKSVKVKFLTGHDEREMMIISDRKKKSGLNTENTVTDRLSRSILSIEGITDRNKINLFVQHMPARDSLALRRFLDDYEPGINMKSHMVCSHCHEESEVDLPIGASFFWPDS
tara:strand:- start:484 stop:1323 length:840 start_codon:yes stop_codon:yes gene_type:complete